MVRGSGFLAHVSCRMVRGAHGQAQGPLGVVGGVLGAGGAASEPKPGFGESPFLGHEP